MDGRRPSVGGPGGGTGERPVCPVMPGRARGATHACPRVSDPPPDHYDRNCAFRVVPPWSSRDVMGTVGFRPPSRDTRPEARARPMCAGSRDDDGLSRGSGRGTEEEA
ncbi:hypothetical protein GCM10009801_72200 [Streptomyces albiaxialis]|uniref:Uncharacterized protein n=1 Tax=Streptomyces albiaxialis TaxID=329523 RepID=A0ABN2WVK2_9ACTN